MEPTELSVALARLDVKLDQLIQQSGDHEARLRKVEEAQTSNKNWQVILANSIMTALNAVLAGTTVMGG